MAGPLQPADEPPRGPEWAAKRLDTSREHVPPVSQRSSGRFVGNTIASRAGSIGTLVGFIRASNESNFL